MTDTYNSKVKLLKGDTITTLLGGGIVTSHVVDGTFNEPSGAAMIGRNAT